MGSTQITTKTVENLDGADDAEPEQLTPLFDRSRDKKSKTISKVSVRRTDPDEGHLGYLPPDCSEHDVAQKWGGGEFHLQAKNDAGQVVQNLTMKIAGDPIFQSEIAEARWRRMNNLRPGGRPSTDGGSLKDVLALIEERESKRREEDRERRTQERQDNLDREERARREQRDHEEKQAKDAADREERRRKDDADRDERRKNEQRADDERRRAQHQEDLARVQAAAAAQLAQTQQFFTQLQAMAKREDRAAGDADPIKILTTGMDLALKMRGGDGGGDPPDALTALLSRLPETLAEVRSTAKEAYHEIKGKKAAPAAATDGEEVTITGPTARRLTQMIGILRRSGKDPEKVLDGLAAHVIGLEAKNKKARAPKIAAAPAPKASRYKPAKSAAKKPK